MTVEEIVKWIMGALAGLLSIFVGNLWWQQQKDKDALHTRISNEQKRINLQSERLAALEADRNSMKEQLNRIEKNFNQKFDQVNEKLDDMFERLLQR